ncbi:MAG: double zinc ribbon domain-containing protein [Patescibacteria group bacterium]|jgi:ComF family protein
MIQKIIQFWIDFLFPKQCFICQKDGEYLCEKCFKSLIFKEAHCPNCNNFSKIGEFCSNCQNKFILTGVLIAGDLKDQKLAKLIKTYKYHFIKELGLFLGQFLSNFLNYNVFVNPIMKSSSTGFSSENVVVIPVPLSKKRLKWRGFNQSEILAKVVAEKCNLEICLNLIRIKHRPAQAKLNLKQRINNLDGCFKWTGESLKNKKIIIVDDVYTTGSTLNEIAREFKKHQAGEIWGLVLAKG